MMKKTYIYQYDEGGNILSKKAYGYNIVSPELQGKPTINEYIYDCEKRDQLIAVNGKMISYDNAGRPTIYKDQSMKWNGFDQLIQVGDQIQYAYDVNGIRKKKVVNGVTTEFITNGSQILSMKHGVATFIFRYVLNKLVGFNYNDNVTSKEYLYQRNIQGDIIGIYDDEGNQVGEYAYDGYGNQVIVKDEGGIASLNPFRYRGYYFDEETGFYYLNARYYDPETGRFISPDTLSILDETKGQINGLNLYMYCADNPIMNDPSGHSWWKWLISRLKIVVGAILVITGVGATLGASLIVGGVMEIAMQFVSSSISEMIGGLGSFANGWGAFSTALSLFSFGPIGIVAGIALGLVGIATMALGVNDVVAGLTGTNYIQEWTGMSDSAYAWMNLGLNLASGLGTVAGRIGMRKLATKISNTRTSSNQKPYSRLISEDGRFDARYDGRGRLSWSRHIHDTDKANNILHWHIEMPHSKEIYDYFEFIIRLIFGRH